MLENPSPLLDPVALADLLGFASTLDLGAAQRAQEALESRFPFEGERIQALGRALNEARLAGEICQRGGEGLRYSRLFPSSQASESLSADAVWMRILGPHHTHPLGEINLCFATEGAPTFDGHGPGWTVYAPGSSHRPHVAGGAMMILYLLPEGAVEFGP